MQARTVDMKREEADRLIANLTIFGPCDVSSGFAF